MTIITRYHPRCDRCGKTSETFFDINERGLFRVLRNTLWTRDRGEDICPACNGTAPDYWAGGF